MRSVRTLAVSGLMALMLVFVTACAAPPPTEDKAPGDAVEKQPTASANTVVIEDFKFVPDTLTVKKGTTVTFVNKDTTKHTITGDDGGPDGSLLAKGEQYTYTFNEVGTFGYHCTPHPFMTANVVVTE